MLNFEHYLNLNGDYKLIQERLMKIDEDVDYLYDKYFRKDIEEIQETKRLTPNMFLSNETDTSVLKTDLSKKANELNKCQILINSKRGLYRNYYKPSANIISLSIHRGAFEYCMSAFGGDLEAAKLSFTREYEFKNFKNEFSEVKIKGSIHHELVHWIDDTLHNQHLFKRLSKAMERDTDYKQKKLPINADKIEIQAQIHNIYQIKRHYGDKWDIITFEDLLYITPILNVVCRGLEEDVRKKWVRDLKRRMHREGLLGKNMVN